MLQHNCMIRRGAWHPIILISATLIASWLGMQAVHELGHCVGAWLTGGRVERVVLHPLTISRTDLGENSQPLVVAWAGPIAGTALPLLLWVAVGRVANHGDPGFMAQPHWFARFFAGFCLVANGLYIGIGSFAGIGDCRELLLHGASRWHLWLFGLVTAPLGLYLWHGLGPRLGFGAPE